MPSRYPCQISSVYSGRTMRSSSVAPSASNTHSSTFVALEENREKLTPRPSQVAPRGLGRPSLSLYRELIVCGDVSLERARAMEARETGAVGAFPQRRVARRAGDADDSRYGRARRRATIGIDDAI